MPKELIARYVRHCPTCTLKRSTPSLDYPIVRAPPINQAERYRLSMEEASEKVRRSLLPNYSSMEPLSHYSNRTSVPLSPTSTYGGSSARRSPMSPILHRSSTAPETSQSLQAIAGGDMMMSSASVSEAAYQYAVGYGSGISTGTGSGLDDLPSMDPHGIYSPGPN